MVTKCINLEKLSIGMIYSDQFKKIIIRYKIVGYNMNVMRQTACLVVNLNTVHNIAARFNCMPAGRASDSMMDPA